MTPWKSTSGNIALDIDSVSAYHLVPTESVTVYIDGAALVIPFTDGGDILYPLLEERFNG